MAQKHNILIIDDTPMMLDALGDILIADYNVLIAKDGERGLKIANEKEIDLILLDKMMPVMSGLEVLKALKSNDKTKNIPVIMVTGQDSEESIEEGFALGAQDYIAKPFVGTLVKRRVRLNLDYSLMSRASNVARKKRVLLIDDTETYFVVLKAFLKEDYETIYAMDGETGIAKAKKCLPDIILLDLMMPHVSGYEVLERLKADEATKSIPVVVASGKDDSKYEESARALGAAGYLKKPFDEIALKNILEKIL